jgi:hypothetical protein
MLSRGRMLPGWRLLHRSNLLQGHSHGLLPRWFLLPTLLPRLSKRGNQHTGIGQHQLLPGRQLLS